ncbi:MAG: glycosyltransferase family 4 protein, partial [Promethearchaeota archaeon]
RILFFSVFFIAKGHETYLADEVLTVAKNYHDIEYIVYTVNQEYNRGKRLKPNILWIQRKKLKNIKVIYLFLRDMIKIFTKFKPDLVHSHYVIESLIMGFISKAFRVPSILHGRGIDINLEPFHSFIKNILARISCKINTKILTVSKAMKINIMKLNVPSNKIRTIYNGVDYNLFKPKNKKIFNNLDRIELTHIGRYSPEKRQDLIIEVIKELKDRNYNVHLSLIGFSHIMFRATGFRVETKIEKQIINLIKKYNLESNVSLLGYIDHNKIPEYLENTHIYIHPSLSEGLPNSVLEAMAMEIPIVMTNVGGMRELKVDQGTILIEPNNKQQLIDGIISFINNPKRMSEGGKRNREFIIKNFSWKYHSQKLYKIYSELSKR